MKREDFVKVIEKRGFQWNTGVSNAWYSWKHKTLLLRVTVTDFPYSASVSDGARQLLHGSYEDVLTFLRKQMIKRPPKKKSLNTRILAAIDDCPLGYSGDTLVLDEYSVPKKVVAWIKRLEAIQEEIIAVEAKK